MDTIIQKQLQVDGIESLKVQNHIYGCFVLMEDIAENVTLDGFVYKKDITFDLDKQFSQIGIRYGFVMDTKLIFDTYLPEYKAAWLALFTEINTKRKVEEVDAIEDSVIELIKNSVKPDMAFFINALKTGSLSQEWIHIVIVLLTTGALPVLEAPATPNSPSTDEQYKTALMNAQVEKICKRGRKTKRNIVVLKKHLGKTRRSHK
jgi:hypothetical protein